MSYCVHCGVKLSADQAKCPLCQTPVIDPVTPYDPKTPHAYPVRKRSQDMDVNPMATLGLAGVLLGVPSVICLLIDLLTDGGVTWSWYPIGAFALLFAGIAVALLPRKNKLYWSIIVDDAALCLYGKLVQDVSQSGTWFQTIVFPVLLLAGVMVLATSISIRQHLLKGLAIGAVTLIELCLLVLFIDLLVTGTATEELRISWSAFVMIPCGVIAAMMLFVHHNGALQNELKRKLHV